MMNLNRIRKGYHSGSDWLLILDNLDLEIKAQEFVSMMGPSGSGKSTLLNILGCLDTADSGVYKLGHEVVTLMNTKQLARVRNQIFGFVFQNFNLVPQYTALQNVMLPLAYAGINEALRRKKAIQGLAEVGLELRCHHLPNELSGGERQRVAIARALINNPEVILADEPTGNLDSASGKMVMQLLRKAHENGKTVIIVTHDEDIAKQSDRRIRVHQGKVRDES